jgi:hypothetical protein
MEIAPIGTTAHARRVLGQNELVLVEVAKIVNVGTKRVAQLRLALGALAKVGNMGLISDSGGRRAQSVCGGRRSSSATLRGMKSSVLGPMPRPGTVVPGALGGDVPGTNEALEFARLVEDDGMVILVVFQDLRRLISVHRLSARLQVGAHDFFASMIQGQIVAVRLDQVRLGYDAQRDAVLHNDDRPYLVLQEQIHGSTDRILGVAANDLVSGNHKT